MRTTLCWDCGSTYPMKQSHCPCGAPNANVDFDAAQAALEAAQADARPAPSARRYALAECRDIQANVMDRAQPWLNAADERGINVTDENGYLAVIRDMMLEVVRLNRYGELLSFAAAALERLRAERDTLAAIVRAADAMALECRRVGLISSTWLEDYDDARAKVKP